MPPKSTPNYTLDEIKQIIAGKLRYFLEMKFYVKGLLEKENFKDEAIDFIYDVLGIEIKDDARIKTCLSEIENKANTIIAHYQCFLKCFQISDTKVAVSVLRILLDYNQLFHGLANSKRKVRPDEKAQFAFQEEEKAALRLLIAQIEKYIPEEYIELRQVISFKQITKKEGAVVSYSVAPAVNWKGYIKNKLDEHKKPIMFGDSKEKRKENIFAVPDPDFESFMTAKVMLVTNEIQALQKLLKQDEQLTIQALFDKFRDQATGFFSVQAKFDELLQLRNKKATEIYQAHTQKVKQEEWQDAVAEVARLKSSLLSAYAGVLQLLGSNLNKEDFAEIKANLDALKSGIDEYDNKWKNPLEESLSREDIKEWFKQDKAAYEQIFKNIDEIKKLIKVKTAELNETLKLEQQAAEKQAQLETQEFFARRHATLVAYRAKVEEEKQKKLASNSGKMEITATQVASQTSSVFKFGLQDLLELKDKKIALIQAILDLDKNIKFSKVVKLIEKSLHGSVSEIGNGSSHKCIQLGNQISIIATCAAIDEQKPTTFIKGTLVNPHGQESGHNSGCLSRFNVKSIRNTFMQAGINDELLKQLAEHQQGSVEVRRLV